MFNVDKYCNDSVESLLANRLFREEALLVLQDTLPVNYLCNCSII